MTINNLAQTFNSTTLLPRAQLIWRIIAPLSLLFYEIFVVVICLKQFPLLADILSTNCYRIFFLRIFFYKLISENIQNLYLLLMFFTSTYISFKYHLNIYFLFVHHPLLYLCRTQSIFNY